MDYGTQASLPGRIQASLKLLADEFLQRPALALFINAITPRQGERYDILMKRLVQPYREALLPLLREAMAQHVMWRQGPETLFLILNRGVGRASCVRPESSLATTSFACADTAIGEYVWETVRAMIEVEGDDVASSSQYKG